MEEDLPESGTLPATLPLEDPVLPLLPPPPPSMQTSNQNSDRLDFGYGDGGLNNSSELSSIPEELQSEILRLDNLPTPLSSCSPENDLVSNLNSKPKVDVPQKHFVSMEESSCEVSDVLLYNPLPIDGATGSPSAFSDQGSNMGTAQIMTGNFEDISSTLRLNDNNPGAFQFIDLKTCDGQPSCRLTGTNTGPPPLPPGAPPQPPPPPPPADIVRHDSETDSRSPTGSLITSSLVEQGNNLEAGTDDADAQQSRNSDCRTIKEEVSESSEKPGDSDEPPRKRTRFDKESTSKATLGVCNVESFEVNIKDEQVIEVDCKKPIEFDDSLEEGEIGSQDEMEENCDHVPVHSDESKGFGSQESQVEARVHHSLRVVEDESTADDTSPTEDASDLPESCEGPGGRESPIDETSNDALEQNMNDIEESHGFAEEPAFEIIDDVGSDDDNGAEDSDDDMDDEIDTWLEEGLDKDYQKNAAGNVNEEDTSSPVVKHKIILKDAGHDPFDILPEGWVMVTHNSGMPVYLHRQSRVCTMARPYFLGPGSARKHDIPRSAIPCLHYARQLVEENQPNASATDGSQPQQDGSPKASLPNGDVADNLNVPIPPQPVSGVNDVLDSVCQSGATGAKSTQSNNSNGATGETSGGDMDKKHSVKVVSVEAYQKNKTLEPLEIREYCKQLFEFTTITVKKYKTWKDRRRHQKMMKPTRPSLPSDTKLITCPILVNRNEEKPSKKKEFILNPAGKSEVCILHEYVQHAMRLQPRYIFRELENVQTPYSASVVINNVEYGTGYASSKKVAKNEAAKATLRILIPDLAKIAEESKSRELHDLSFFDEVKIEDPRVHELCNKAGQPSPFQILCECLRRNFGMGDTQCQMEMKALKHQKSEFTMKVGKHTATVICRNKREGKQQAAQAILQRLHPHITSWGSLLRLYGTDWKAIKEKEDDVSVTALYAKARTEQSNDSILNKLKDEMTKLQMRRNAMKSNIKGKLELGTLPSTSSVPGVDL